MYRVFQYQFGEVRYRGREVLAALHLLEPSLSNYITIGGEQFTCILYDDPPFNSFFLYDDPQLCVCACTEPSLYLVFYQYYTTKVG